MGNMKYFEYKRVCSEAWKEPLPDLEIVLNVHEAIINQAYMDGFYDGSRASNKRLKSTKSKIFKTYEEHRIIRKI